MTAHRSATRFPNLARLALLAGAAVGLTACVAHPPRYGDEYAYYEPDRTYYEPERTYYAPPAYYAPSVETYDYVYYPAIGAYYDPRISVYYYYEHNHWTRTRSLPSHCRPYLDHHVSVHAPRDRPYADHDRHREHYAPERYRKPHDNRLRTNYRSDDVWVGAPRASAKAHGRNEAYKNNGNRDRNGARPERDRTPAQAVPPLRAQDTERERMRHEEPARNRDREHAGWRDNNRGHGTVTPPQSREHRAPTSPQYKTRVLTNAGKPHVQRTPSVIATTDKQSTQASAQRKAKSDARDENKKAPKKGRAHEVSELPQTEASQ